MTAARDRQLLRAYTQLPCEACGATMEAGVNAHIRECKKQDVREIAHRILERDCFVDAEAELVAAAYLLALLSERGSSAAGVDGAESPTGPQGHHEPVGERQGRQPRSESDEGVA